MRLYLSHISLIAFLDKCELSFEIELVDKSDNWSR